MAAVHAPARLVGVVERQVHPSTRHAVRSMESPCSTAPCCTSRARAVSARRPSRRRSGWRPRRAGGGRSSARSPSRTASRAPSPARACSASRRSSSPRTSGRSASTRPRRWRSGSGASSAGRALRLITGSSAFQHFVAAAPGRQGADHDRQGLGARAARALGRREPHLRPRDRRRARLRARPGDADGAEHVRRDRARRADPAPGVQDPRHARRPAADRLRRGRAAGGDAGERDARARRPAARRDRAGARRDRRQRRLSRRASRQGGRSAARGGGDGLEPDALAAVGPRWPSTSARTQRAHLRRLRREAGAPVHTLPFLFDAEVGLDEYATLAAKLGRPIRCAFRRSTGRRASRSTPYRARSAAGSARDARRRLA